MNTNACTIDADQVEVPFSFFDADARSVCLAIFFNDWSPQPTSDLYLPWSGRGLRGPPIVRTLVPMAEIEPGFWRCEAPLLPGWCEYLFLVDGEWMLDPQAPEKCLDGDGDFNSARRIEPIASTATFPSQPVRVAARRQRDTVRRPAA